MKIILEKALDYKRFKNVLILNLVLFALLFGIIFFEKSVSKVIIYILSLVCIFLSLLLLLKKGLECDSKNVSLIFSLFGFVFTIKKIQLNQDSVLSFKKFISSNNYQGHHVFDKPFHLEEHFYELYIDNINLVTLHSKIKYDLTVKFIEENSVLKL
jgi:hypothetical protein